MSGRKRVVKVVTFCKQREQKVKLETLGDKLQKKTGRDKLKNMTVNALDS